MLSFRAVISYYLILFRSIAALQVAAIKNLFHFYSSPVALGQIYFVLVLISTNHNADTYIQKWISPGLNNIQGKEVVPNLASVRGRAANKVWFLPSVLNRV